MAGRAISRRARFSVSSSAAAPRSRFWISAHQTGTLQASGVPELVVLRHSNGVDMVLITRDTQCSVTKVSAARLGHANSTA